MDAAILVLESMRESIQEIELEHLQRFVLDILSGEVLNKYHVLVTSNPLQIGQLLRYVQNDVDGAIAVLQVAHLLDREMYHLLGGNSVVDLVKEYIIFTLPDMINEVLEVQNPILAELGVGELVTALLTPAIHAFDVPTTIRALQVASSTLSYIIPLYDRLEVLVNLDRNIAQTEIDQIIAHVRQRSAAVESAIRNNVDAIWNQIQGGASDAFDDLRNQLQTMAQSYREIGRNNIRNFLNNSTTFLRNLLRRP